MFYTFVSFQLVHRKSDRSMMKTCLIGSSVVVQSMVMPALSVDSQSTTSLPSSVVTRLVKVEVPNSVVSPPVTTALVVVVFVVAVVLSVVTGFDVVEVVLVVVLIMDDSVVGWVVVFLATDEVA